MNGLSTEDRAASRPPEPSALPYHPASKRPERPREAIDQTVPRSFAASGHGQEAAAGGSPKEMAASRPPEPSAGPGAMASRASRETDQRRSPIEEILASRQAAVEPNASRYGEGDGRRRQKEREEIRESYLAIDIRLRSGEYCGLFYIDLAGSPRLSADHTTLTVPFRGEKLIIRGYRLLEVYRAVLHYSLDILEETHRAVFDAAGEGPVIESIEIVSREEEQ